MNVLLVEDEKLSQIVAKNLLENINCNVDIAESGEQALILTKSNFYDVIFIDLGLPDMSGTRISKNIRGDNKNPNQNSIIIALTAHQDDISKVNCVNAKMNDVIVKPLTREKISEIIGQYLGTLRR
jgi:two-component system aerobic respiration control sensor histidine kinase ArcB